MHVHPDEPDFASAVAALQSLIPPKRKPYVAESMEGRVLAMRGEVEEPFEWEVGGYTYRFHNGIVEWKPSREARWICCEYSTEAWNQSCRYERERGHADE
jgi:hypothetical protein